MRFSSNLTEAILLKRSIKFLAEIVLPNNQKLMIRCPNLNSMLGCDILGTKVWYSHALGSHCLPTWELVEVDGGHLVCINNELVKSLVIEAIKNNVISELINSQLLPITNDAEPNNPQILFLEQHNKKCYLCLEQVTFGTEQGEGFFPERVGVGISNICRLIEVCKAGHAAVLFFCVMHNGVSSMHPAYHIDQRYGYLLQVAIEAGVQVIAYKTDIDLQGIKLVTKLPIVLSEDTIYR